MEIAQLVRELNPVAITGSLEGDVSAVVYNSSAVTPGVCFVAVPGRRADGYAYVPDALARGAILIVGEQPPPPDFPSTATYAQVHDARRDLGTLAAMLSGHPSHHMEVIGITGTDGKTTTTNLVDAILSASGRHMGLMSTVDFKIGAERVPNNSRFTTLEAPEVQGTLARMRDAGVECAIVETTSSGLALHRVRDVEYDIAVITNITSEHLEVHGSLEAYWRAKAMLFEMVSASNVKPVPFAIRRACILNADDPSYGYLCDFCQAPIVSYGIENAADVRAEYIQLGASGTEFTVSLPSGESGVVCTPLVARFNVSNCLAAIAVGYLHGMSLEQMADVLARFPGVSGRMERIDSGQPFTVVVDYAHTADSLAKVLDVLRPVTAGKLIAVFGSAGERDTVKRPEMGAVAARLADFAVITDEDPREEDAVSILRDIATGAESMGAREHIDFECVVGRRSGIATAFRRAQPGDTVLLAGKGHEQSIIIGREKLPWDDRTVAREELAALGYEPYTILS